MLKKSEELSSINLILDEKLQLKHSATNYWVAAQSGTNIEEFTEESDTNWKISQGKECTENVI